MRDGRFYAYDLVDVAGQDARPWPWIERRAALLDMAAQFPPGLMLAPEGSGAEFLEAVLRDSGEGIVAKQWGSPYYGATWIKVKRQETFDCVVTELRGSIRLALDGEDCGWCPARAAFHSIRLGAVVEVAAFGRHASGKFREVRFVRVRPDKTFEVKA